MANNNITIQKSKGGVEDLSFGLETETQTRAGKEVTITQVNANHIPFDATMSAKEKFDDLEARVGIPGPEGPVGPTGPTGPQGIQGIQGIQGETGDTGAGVLVTGVDTWTNIQLLRPILNELWIVSSQDGGPHLVGDGVIWDGAAWVNAGQIRGPQGIQGETGDTGPQGTSVDHISQTSGTGAPGTADGYTAWADAGETISLGSFSVYNGVNGVTGGIVKPTTTGSTMDLSVNSVLRTGTLGSDTTIAFINPPAGGSLIWYVDVQATGFNIAYSMTGYSFKWDGTEIPAYGNRDTIQFQLNEGSTEVRVTKIWSDTESAYVEEAPSDGRVYLRRNGAWVGSAPTSTPILDVTAVSVPEGLEHTVTITNIGDYNSPVITTKTVESGSYVDNLDGTLTYTAPTYTGVDDSHIGTIKVTDVSYAESEAATITYTIQDLQSDTGILHEGATLNDTTIPTTPNSTITNNVLIADADGAESTSLTIVSGNTNTNATPTVTNTAQLYTISAGATNTSVTVVGDVLTDGDTILINDGAVTTLQGYDTTSKVTELNQPHVNTKLLLHFDGDVVDAMGNHTVTVNGTVPFDTATTKFGSASVDFDGSTSNYLSIPSSPDFDFGTGDFTIDFWVMFDDITSDSQIMNINGNELFIYVNGKKNDLIIATNRQAIEIREVDWGLTHSSGVWYHFAMIASCGTTKFYVDGTALAGTMATTAFSVGDLQIGKKLTMGANIHIDEFSLVKGTAKWTSNFTPPTSPYGWSYTVDLTAAGLTSAPTIVAKDTADISTSIVSSGATALFEARTVQSHTANVGRNPTEIVDVFDADTRQGLDVSYKLTQGKTGDKVTSISIPMDKVV